ncbi:GntR family transcriptional regulator [Blastopirellula sp. J2-11]|uniref:GntR family transcriptional regulator n=1 Tax=Blastopirellula sp. J2-11 TaxID=2943192 RepID=UPI0021C7862E|nr:GntR family transcriptional regulator [Blastopirellula sp. J2-11]UUO07161.1 GntR family transcriptional regulator [Blastopirellula sp. J2-11]
MARQSDTQAPPTKARRIFLDLRSKILSRKIDANTQLTLRPIASEYGTGINAASEAIKALAAEGFVTLEGKAGARVITRDLHRIRAEGVLRIAIECEAIRRCAMLADDIQLSVLGGLAEKVDRLFEEGNQLDQCRQADIAFHVTITDFCGVPELRESLIPLLDRLVTLDQTEKRTSEIPGQKHLEVYEGLKSRDPVQAADVMRHHLEHSLSLTLALLYT